MTEESVPEGSQDGQMQWYVLKIQSNREKTIRDSLLRRIRQEGLQDSFGDIVIPTEKIVENRNGKKTSHRTEAVSWIFDDPDGFE